MDGKNFSKNLRCITKLNGKEDGEIISSAEAVNEGLAFFRWRSREMEADKERSI